MVFYMGRRLLQYSDLIYMHWVLIASSFVFDLWMLSIFICFFFFSSRRRHTRCLSDWSSDVCSSDLDTSAPAACARAADAPHARGSAGGRAGVELRAAAPVLAQSASHVTRRRVLSELEIGRASCRERV